MRLHLAFWSVAGVVASSIALAQVPPADEAPADETAPEAEAPTPPASSSAAPSASATPPAASPTAAAAAPEESAPTAAAPPVGSRDVASVSVSAQPSRSVEDSGASEDRGAPPPETTLGFELDGGFGARLGSASDYGFTSGERTGLVFGPSVWLAPARIWAVGLGYERSTLGTDSTQPSLGAISVKRDLDAVWLSGRAFPWRTDSMGVFVALGLGVSWQHLHADGTRVPEGSVSPGSTFDCGGSDGPGLALGGGLGLDVDLDRNLAFVTQVQAAGHRHTSETLDACAPGSGSLTLVSGRIGFAYRFDLDEPVAGGKNSARAR
jgi:hypothetical protein